MTPKEILIQGIGVLGILASILSFQCRKHSRILALRTANELLFAVQYAMLGAYTGMAMNLVGCVRNTVFSAQVRRGQSTQATRLAFSALFLIMTALTWAGPKSLLSGVAKVVSTYAYGSSNTALVRLMILFTSTCWLIYNAAVGSYAGVACEGFTLCSIVVGMIRLDLPAWRAKRKKGAN